MESLGLPDDLSQVRALSAQLRTATADWRRLQQGVEAVGGDVTAGIALEAVAQARVQLQVTLRHLDEQTILGTAISRDVLVKHSLIPELNAYDHALARFAALQSRQGEQALEAAERERGGSWWVGLSALLCLALSAAVAMSLMARRMRPASPIGPTTLSRPAMLAATSPVGPVVREDGDEQSSDHHLGWALNVHAPQVGPVPYGSMPLTGHGVQHAGGIAGMGGPFAPRPTAGVGEQG